MLSYTNTETIRRLNDCFRRCMVFGGRILLTQGVAALSPADRTAVLKKVRDTDQFDRDNDPHHVHGFGAIEHNRVAYFWKIDCYDLACRYGSPDPANPAVTTRVLTIMRADEL